jgi:hypothetical protein
MVVYVVCGIDIAGMLVVVVKIPTIAVTTEYLCNEAIVIVFGRPQVIEYPATVQCDSLVSRLGGYRCEGLRRKFRVCCS